jgi:hypothetical protein
MGEGDETDKWALAASERKRREREGAEALTGSRARGWAAWAGERGGEARACGRVGSEFGPAEGGGSFLFLFFF